jgi:RNA methyltransferase, TrmH family
MISNNQIKLFSSFRNKKYREIHNQFLAEGEKIVLDILKSPSRIFKIHCLIATAEFIKVHGIKSFHGIPEILEATEDMLGKISSLSTPNKAILVCGMPQYSPDFKDISGGLSLFLDDIRDPGNLGTIMRTADWFGIHHIFCTRESVDVFNPKTVQSTMGALCRVKVYYIEVSALLKEVRKFESYPLVGTVLDGKNIYTCDLPDRGMIVLGNESRGISETLLKAIEYKVTIPAIRNSFEISESLNVASAGAIVMAEFRRRQLPYSK